MKQVTTLAIVGGGELGNMIQHHAQDRYDTIDIICHNNFDITDRIQCDNIVPKLTKYDAVIITAGSYSEDIWSMALINTVGPCYLIAKLNEVSVNQRIIAVSSHGATWTSWPGIPTFKLSYNINKLALTEFCKGLVQQGTGTNKITVIEPGKFKSKMSKGLGADINNIAQQVLEIVNSPVHVVHVIVKNL